MTKKKFLKELNTYLKNLTKETREEELKKYEDLNNYDLDPLKIANDIYASRGINITIKPKLSLFNSVNIIINKLQSKDSKITKNILLFFLYLFFLLILIKIPFIYIRDIITSLFATLFTDNNIYIIWNLTFEFLYAITTIIVFIKLIKNKALELENTNQNN